MFCNVKLVFFKFFDSEDLQENPKASVKSFFVAAYYIFF